MKRKMDPFSKWYQPSFHIGTNQPYPALHDEPGHEFDNTIDRANKYKGNVDQRKLCAPAYSKIR